MPKPQGVISQWPVLAATPAGNPPAGHRLIYYKTDGSLYQKDSAGIETPVSTGGGGSVDPATVVTIADNQTISGAKRFTSTSLPHPPIIESPDASPPLAPVDGDLWIVPDANPVAATANFVVSATQPSFSGPGLWVETGLGESGEDYTIWIETGD